jgi:hypothetical protein
MIQLAPLRRVAIYGYQWAYGPFRWSYSRAAAELDRAATDRFNTAQRYPSGAVGPVEQSWLHQLIDEHSLYIGDSI